MSLPRFLALVALCAPCQMGCALTGKADALSPRYFNPQVEDTPRAEPAPAPFELRLGQVASASHLDERISYRMSPSEVGFYDDRRWTELPEAYLRRALERELFERRGLTRVVSGSAPVLDVELTAFEELRAPRHQVRVSLTFSLRDERRSLLERSLELEAPLEGGGDEAERVAATLAATLGAAVRAACAEVVQRLAAPPAKVAPAGAPSP